MHSKKRAAKSRVQGRDPGARPSPTDQPSRSPQPSPADQLGSTDGPTPRVNIGISLLILIFTTSTACGYFFGKAWSPDYSNPKRAERAIARWVFDRVELNDTKWQVKGNFTPNSVVVLSLQQAIVTFGCGGKQYRYDIQAGAFTERPIRSDEVSCGDLHASPQNNNDPRRQFLELADLWRRRDQPISFMPAAINEQYPTHPRKGITFQDTLLIIAGAGQAYSLRDSVISAREYWITRKTRSLARRSADALVMVSALISGFSLGYYWGYENDPNCGEDVFRRQLEDAHFWSRIAPEIARFYTFAFKLDPMGTVIRADTPSHRSVNLRETYLTLRAARLIDCDPVALRFSDGLVKLLTANSEALYRDASDPLWLKTWRLISLPWSKTYLARTDDDRRVGKNWWKRDADGRWKPLGSRAFDGDFTYLIEDQ